MTDKPEIAAWGSFYKGVMQDFGYNHDATEAAAKLDFYGLKLSIEALIRLTDHEDSRAADKARIEELQAALRKIAGEVDGNIRGCVRDCVNQRGNVQDIYDYCDNIDNAIDAALAQQGKEGGE